MGGTHEKDLYGAGIFGHWSTDDDGRPVYVYTMDHPRDPRAVYRTTLGESRNHWHQVGTGEFVATVHNEGYCQLYDWSRGGKLGNRWNPAQGHFAGGFLLVEYEGESFSTLYSALPPGATQERRFGCNYAERITHYRDLRITERLNGELDTQLSVQFTVEYLPAPSVPVCAESVPVRVFTPWWLHPAPITPAPLMTYGTRRRIEAARLRRYRRSTAHASMHRFTENGITCGFLRVDVAQRRPVFSRRSRARTDLTLFTEAAPEGTPQPWFVALPATSIEQNSVTGLPQRLRLEGASRHEDAQAIGKAVSDYARYPKGQSATLGAFSAAEGTVVALAFDLTLAPGECTTHQYAIDCLSQHPREAHLRDDAPDVDNMRTGEILLEVPAHPALARELRWHSAYLRGGAYFSSYHEAHFVDQGSAYSYLQGLSGAPRDYALFVLPMVHLHPFLAKDMLRHLFACQHHRTGKLPYANVGHGQQRGYLLHSFSSDLDLFLLWAAGEYLAATRDFAFLAEELLYYPKQRKKSGTALDHLRAAFTHLTQRVGLGPHGLLRSGSGDWNDVLLGYSRCAPLTFLRGESSLNAGLAAFALPRLARTLAQHAPDFAAALKAFADAQAAALLPLWTGRWAARGYLGYLNKKLGEDRLFLDTQPFGVLAGVWNPDQRTALFAAIDELCATPQKVGARCLWPPMTGPLLQPGSDTNGGTWAAIDALVAWAWATHDPARAWDFFLSTTLAARAEAYPEVWYGVWSGPDSFNAHHHARPGETFSHNFTPMTDFPIMNMNRHAGPLLDAIKFAGIEPTGDAIEIRPRVPGDTFTFRSHLIHLDASPTHLRGTYTPICVGTFHFRIAAPKAQNLSVTVNGEARDLAPSAEGFIAFSAAGNAGTPITWDITGE